MIKCSDIVIKYIPYETSIIDVQGKKHFRREAAEVILTTYEYKKPMDIKKYIQNIIGGKKSNIKIAELVEVFIKGVEEGKFIIYYHDGFYILKMMKLWEVELIRIKCN